METIEFVILGRPVPAAYRGGKRLKSNTQRYLAYREQIKTEARRVMAGRQPLESFLGVEIIAVVNGNPGDIDNIAKSLLDGCNKVIWEDDTQVVALHAYRRTGRPQRAEIKVYPIEVLA